MKKGEDFEAYLASFGAVEPPQGAKERILLPALAVANVADKAQAGSSALSLGEQVGSFFESLFAVPLRVFALSSLLVAANFAMDGQTPKLSAELAAGRGPNVAFISGQTAKRFSRTVSRGWFADVKTFHQRRRGRRGRHPRKNQVRTRRRPGPSINRLPKSPARRTK